MNKFKIIMISALFAIAFSACTKDDTTPTAPNLPNIPNTPVSTQTVDIGDISLIATGVPVIDKNNNSYIIYSDLFGTNTTICCIAADNTKKWSSSISDNTENLVADDNYVYVAGKNKLYALNLSDGSEAWQYTLTDESASISTKWTYKPCIDPSGNIIVAMDSYLSNDILTAIPSRVISLSTSGTRNWEHVITTGDNENDKLTKLSAPIATKNNIYLAALISSDSKSTMQSIAIDFNGNEKYKLDHGELTGGAITCANSDGDVFVQLKNNDDYSGKIVKMSSSLSEIWTKDMPDYLLYNGIIDADGNYYANCEDGFVYKLNNSGNEIWKTDLGRIFVRGQMVLCADGNIYKTNQQPEYINAETGKTTSISTIQSSSSDLAVRSDGTIIYGNSGKAVLLPSTSKGIDTNAQWAKYGYDNNNSSLKK